MNEQAKAAVILLGENNALIPIGGIPVIKRQILRCLMAGLQQIYVIGHFTPEVLELLHSDPSIKKATILQNNQANPWQKIQDDNYELPILVISSEHYMDMDSFEFSLNKIVEPHQVIFFGDNDPNQVATSRKRILLTSNGKPINLLERAKGQAVWIGLTLLGSKAVTNLSNRKGGIHFETLKQAGILASAGSTYLQCIHTHYWERIDSNLMGNYATREILYLIEEEGFRPLQKLECGFTEKILAWVNYNNNWKNLFIVFSFLICLLGGFMITQKDINTNFIGLSISLLGIILASAATEIKSMLCSQNSQGLEYSMLAKRGLMIGICLPYLLAHHDLVSYVALLLIFGVTYLELKNDAFIFQMEKPLARFNSSKTWHRTLMRLLSLEWVWYGVFLMTILNLISYFRIITIEFYFFYIIFLIQMPKNKKYVPLEKELETYENN